MPPAPWTGAGCRGSRHRRRPLWAITGSASRPGETARCCSATIATAATPAATAAPATGRHQRNAPGLRVRGGRRAPPSMAALTPAAKPRLRSSRRGAPQRFADQRVAAESFPEIPHRAVRRFSSSSVSVSGSSPSRNAETCSRICSLMVPRADQDRHQKWVAASCR